MRELSNQYNLAVVLINSLPDVGMFNIDDEYHDKLGWYDHLDSAHLSLMIALLS